MGEAARPVDARAQRPSLAYRAGAFVRESVGIGKLPPWLDRWLLVGILALGVLVISGILSLPALKHVVTQAIATTASGNETRANAGDGTGVSEREQSEALQRVRHRLGLKEQP